MVTVHHLGVSQSERIIWLFEELGLPYDLKAYQRDAVTQLSPPELFAAHPLGSAPVITDGDKSFAESGAIIEYVIHRYGGGRLSVGPEAANYADYLYWLHYANGSLMQMVAINGMAGMISTPDNPVAAMLKDRIDRHLTFIDDHLATSDYFAGPEFTAADIIMHFPFTTMKAFFPVDSSDRKNIQAWLKRISARPAYQKAMKVAGHDQDPAVKYA